MKKCPNCGLRMDRDVNAAINIAQEAARNVVLERGGRVSPVAIQASAGEVKRTTLG